MRREGEWVESRMRGSGERCVAGRGGEAGEGEKGQERDAESQGPREQGRKENEGVAGRVTEKDCATDGDTESQPRRELEWRRGAGGTGRRGRGQEQVRGSRLGEEAERGRGRSRFRGDFSHPRWPWLSGSGEAWHSAGGRTPPRCSGTCSLG